MIRAVLALVLTLTASVAWAQPTPAAALKGRIGIDERLDGPAVAVPALERARVATSDLPIFVRLTVPLDTLQRASTGDWSALDERIDAYKQRSIPVLLAIGTPAGSLPTADTLTPVIRAAAQHLRGRVAGYQLDVAGGPPPDPQQYGFLLKLAAVQIRAIDADVFIAQATARSADTVWLTAVYADGIAPYVDLAPIAAPMLRNRRRLKNTCSGVASRSGTSQPRFFLMNMRMAPQTMARSRKRQWAAKPPIASHNGLRRLG